MSEIEQKIICRSGPWRSVVSRSRADQIYYFNCKTGETSWTKPPIFDCQCEIKVENTADGKLNRSNSKLKMKTSTKKVRNSNASAPYHKRRSEDESHKAEGNKQAKERKNLGSFAHTFNPPPKSSEQVASSRPASSDFRVSLNVRNKKSPRVVKAPSSVFGEEVEINAENTSRTPQSTPSAYSRPRSSARPWVPFGVPKSSMLPDNQPLNKNRPDVIPSSAKQGSVKQADHSAELGLVLRSNRRKRRRSEKSERLTGGEVLVERLSERRSLPCAPASTKRKSAGLGEERMWKLRNNLTEELLSKPDKALNKGQLPPTLSQGDPKEPVKRKDLLPTPPSSMKSDRISNTEKKITIIPEKRAVKERVFTTPPAVVKIDNLNLGKGIQNVTTGTRKIRSTSSECTKIDDNSNINLNISPDVCQHQENLTSAVVGHSSNSNAAPAAEVFESEAMDVEEEAQVLSDIKALRTTVTWEPFDTEWTPIEIENVEARSDTPKAVLIVLDTNILLSHLSFVQELRDTVKLYGDHPFLYLPWMVLQELDRLKDRNAKAAKGARAAISFLNDTFKRKHPRVRGQTGRDATRARKSNVDELCPDDSILESCLQLQEQGCHTLLLSNDVSLCNKALVHGIKAVTKVQLTNEIWNSAETNNLLYTGRTPSPEKKVFVMDRLRSERQPTEPAPVKSHIVQLHSNQFETPQTSSVLEGIKKILLDTFSKLLSTAMEAEYGSSWTKRVLYKPPWELHNIFICVAKHWFALCDNTTPEAVQKAANKLKNIFLKGAKNDSIGEIINLTMGICDRLPFKYDRIIAPLEQQIKAFTSGLINKTVDQNCHSTENQSNISTEQSVDCIVSAYFGSLWNILHSFCINLKHKLDNGISLDSDTRIHSKEMLCGTVELIDNIKGILSVPENELSITHPGLQGILEILRSATPPPGAEPLQLQHVYGFCVHPDKRGVLRNGLFQLEDCEILLKTALK